MTKDELLEALIKIEKENEKSFGYNDCERNHFEADELLLKYIDDKRITDAFNDIEKWYA